MQARYFRSDLRTGFHALAPRVEAEHHGRARLADWITATAAMMAAGFVDADAAFLPHIHLPSGQRVVDARSVIEFVRMATNAPMQLIAIAASQNRRRRRPTMNDQIKHEMLRSW